MKEEVFTHCFLETEGMAYGGEVWQREQGEKVGGNLYYHFCGTGQAKQGKQL